VPHESVVRPEEFVNAFDYNYSLTGQKTFSIVTDCVKNPLNPNLHILKVGIKGKVLGRDGRKPVHVVLVVDTSGSMAKETRLPMVKKGIEQLVTNMQKGDRISLVTYGSEVMLNLEYSPIENLELIQKAVEELKTGGSTDLAKGVFVGYQIAATHFKKEFMNQVIICSDGVANVGHLEADRILKKVEVYKKQGISFTSIGFGSGDYNDQLLEKLALRGDGFYYYVNSEEDVNRVFAKEIGASFSVIAKDVKLQVAFKENRVTRYRLIGYEAREVKDKDFRNNAVDGGEIISGKSVTAIYELELAKAESAQAFLESLGTVTIRFQNIETNEWEEDAVAITGKIQNTVSVKENPYFYLGYCAATFAEIMRKSPYVKGTSIGKIEEYVKKVSEELELNNQVKDLLKNIQLYEKLRVKE
jgi:Ca-activated chloride channel family protein